MLSYKMKDKLGFTVREHREWTEQKGYITDIRLDFYNEPKRTMFLLKYSEYLDKTGKTALDQLSKRRYNITILKYKGAQNGY